MSQSHTSQLTFFMITRPYKRVSARPEPEERPAAQHSNCRVWIAHALELYPIRPDYIFIRWKISNIFISQPHLHDHFWHSSMICCRWDEGWRSVKCLADVPSFIQIMLNKYSNSGFILSVKIWIIPVESPGKAFLRFQYFIRRHLLTDNRHYLTHSLPS